MASTAQASKTSATTRRFGYVVAILVNIAMWYVIYVWPGWEAVPFLTEDTRQVLGLVSLSLAANIVANVVYLVLRRPWVEPLGNMLTTAIGLVALVRFLQVFPFDFGIATVDWATVTRVLLILGIVGAAIGIVVQFARLIKRIIEA